VGSVVVVGGGVAGLTCAWRLSRAGHDVEVLEREAAPGGRMRSEDHGGYRIERGAQFLTRGYHNLHAIADALGIGGSIRSLGRPRDAVLRDGRLHELDFHAAGHMLQSRLLSGRAKGRLLRLPIELLRQRKYLDPLHPERAACLDRENLADGLRRLVGDEAVEYLLAPVFSSRFATEPEELSLAFGLIVLRMLAGDFQLEAFEGGNGALTRALAETLRVRCGCRVTSVETETDGARVRYEKGGRSGSVFADAVVVALPGSLVAAVCPKLTPEERGFFEAVRYNRGTIVHLLLDRRPATLPYYGVAFLRREGLDLYGLAVDHHKPGVVPHGAGLVNGVLNQAATERLWDASDDEVGNLVVENLTRTPVGRLAPVDCVVHRWDPMLPQFGVGYLPRLARFSQRMNRSPRSAFAGDYLVGSTTEAALTSGMRAATEIADQLRT